MLFTDAIAVPVVGVTFEGRQSLIEKLRDGDKLMLVPEFWNKFDDEAVSVRNENNESIGYIPKGYADKGKLFHILMEDVAFEASVSNIRGGGRYSLGLDVLFRRIV